MLCLKSLSLLQSSKTKARARRRMRTKRRRKLLLFLSNLARKSKSHRGTCQESVKADKTRREEEEERPGEIVTFTNIGKAYISIRLFFSKLSLQMRLQKRRKLRETGLAGLLYSWF